MGAADFVANGGGQVQFAADAEPEVQLVEHGAGGPVVVSDPGHGGKPQAGHVADDFEHRRYGTDTANSGDVGGFLPHSAVSIGRRVGVVPTLMVGF